MSDGGLIGNWSPGIGDPSIGGWLTVVLYFCAAYGCFRLARGKNVKLVRREASVWWLFTLGLIALGINKQLDLQSALTEIGRILAREQGWYEERRVVQAEFIGLLGLLGLVSIAFLVWITRRMPAATRAAVAGGVALVAFVAVRAASFHNFDRLIGRSLFGMKVNWVLEIGGISIILAATYFRAARSPTGVGQTLTGCVGATTLAGFSRCRAECVCLERLNHCLPRIERLRVSGL